MNCYLCDSVGEVTDAVAICRECGVATDAVAICRECGVALCRGHVDQAMLAQRPAGLVRAGCIHDPLGTARRRREIQELEAMW